jgi:YHYH protein
MSGDHSVVGTGNSGLSDSINNASFAFDDHVTNVVSGSNTGSDSTRQILNPPSPAGNSGVDITNLPIGGIVTNTVNTTGPVKGKIYVSVGSYNVMLAGTTGNVAKGAWINPDGVTYDKTKKAVVSGSVTWPYQYSTGSDGTTRTIKGNTLPSTTTGTYPIDPTTVAYTIDPNPNQIGSENYTITMPSDPQPATTASPLGLGAIGVMTNGGLLYAGVDGKGNDANAYEVQDSNVGHPSETDHYHTHQVPETLYSEILGRPNTTKLVGYAADGYAIVAETGSDGNLLSTSQLDEFHGNTSTYIDENGQSVTRFHYTVSQDWPYTIGAFKGTPAPFDGLHTDPTTVTTRPPPPLGFEPAGIYWDAANSKLYAKIGNEWVQGAIMDQAGQYVNGMGYSVGQNGQWVAPTGEVQYKAADGRTFGFTVHYNKGPLQTETLFQATYQLDKIYPWNLGGRGVPIYADTFTAYGGGVALQGKVYDSTGAVVNGDGTVHFATGTRNYGTQSRAPIGDMYFASNDGRYFSVVLKQGTYDGEPASIYIKRPIA